MASHDINGTGDSTNIVMIGEDPPMGAGGSWEALERLRKPKRNSHKQLEDENNIEKRSRYVKRTTSFSSWLSPSSLASIITMLVLSPVPLMSCEATSILHLNEH